MTQAKRLQRPITTPLGWSARASQQLEPMATRFISFFAFFACIAAVTASACPRVFAVELSPSKAPFKLQSTSVRFIQNLAYGPHARHTLDIFTPVVADSSTTRTPLVIFIHGGGFSSGSKEKAYTPGNRQTITRLLDNGIAYASINYPLIEKNDREGLIKSLHGAKRALQFIRLNHNAFNIDPEKIILLGSSAGGSTALWLAFHDDMANPHSQDPVEHQSTRVLAAAVSEVQSSLDIVRWEEVLKQYRFSVKSMEQVAKRFYGIDSLEQLYSSAIGYRQKVDLLPLMDASDPEIWVTNQNTAAIAPRNPSTLYHHPYHARALRDRAASVGLKGSFYIPKLDILPSRQESISDFVLRKARQG